MYSEQASILSRTMQTLFLQKDIPALHTQTALAIGGAERDRTADPLLAKQVLSQLSYSPINSTSATNLNPSLPSKRMVGPGRLELPTPRLSSVCSNQLSYGPIQPNI